MYRRNHSRCNVCKEWNHDDGNRQCDRCEETICNDCYLPEEYLCENCAWVRLRESLEYYMESGYYKSRSDGREFTVKDFVQFARDHYTIREIFNDPITDQDIIKAYIKENPKPPENENAIIGKIVWG